MAEYETVTELFALLDKRSFKVSMSAGFPANSDSTKDKFVSFLKQAAVKLHLVPKTMKGKEKLKRLFFGKLQPLPPELTDGMAEYIPPAPISENVPDKSHKVIYAVGHVGLEAQGRQQDIFL